MTCIINCVHLLKLAFLIQFNQYDWIWPYDFNKGIVLTQINECMHSKKFSRRSQDQMPWHILLHCLAPKFIYKAHDKTVSWYYDHFFILQCTLIHYKIFMCTLISRNCLFSFIMLKLCSPRCWANIIMKSRHEYSSRAQRTRVSHVFLFFRNNGSSEIYRCQEFKKDSSHFLQNRVLVVLKPLKSQFEGHGSNLSTSFCKCL